VLGFKADRSDKSLELSRSPPRAADSLPFQPTTRVRRINSKTMKARITPPARTLQFLKSMLVQVCAFLPALFVSAQVVNQIKSFPAVALDPSTGFYTNSDGAYPRAPLTLAGATLYGAAIVAGSSGSGTIFKINTDGSGFAVLRSLAAATDNSATQQLTNSDGAQPQSRLLVAGDTVYGTALYGGALGNGTL